MCTANRAGAGDRVVRNRSDAELALSYPCTFAVGRLKSLEPVLKSVALNFHSCIACQSTRK